MPSFRAAPVRVRVPATSANLGPGFDTAGLALALYDDVVVRIADSGLTVDVAGEGADDLPRDKRHLVVKALRATFAVLGGQPRGLEVVCANRIPQSRGLGSSSAAICAAVLAARALVLGGEETLSDDDALDLATRLEGHPDNVAACLRGGLTFAWMSGTSARVARVDVHPDIRPVAFIPSSRASTKKVRGMLPETVPHADAAANSARTALLTLALTRSPELLLDATEDFLHQGYRAPAMPRTAALVEQLRADGVPAFVSGAGPTVLALATSGTLEAVAARHPRAWDVVPLPVDSAGAQALPL
jgi:homoserine kinase